MINSELIFNNIEKFDIYPSHMGVFSSILDNIETEKRILIRGEQLSGKTFFCRKLVYAIKEKLNLKKNKIKFYDLPLILLKIIGENDISVINFDVIRNFIEKNNPNKILKIDSFDLIVLDDINDLFFADTLKIEYNLNDDQILFQLIEDNLYYTNKNEIEKMNYSIYQLDFPPLTEIKIMIEEYMKIFKNYTINLVNLTKDKFKALIT